MWPCWSDGYATSAPPMTCRWSAPARRWPPAVPVRSATPWSQEVATRLFGAEVTPERVIGETLIRSTPDSTASGEALRSAVHANAVQAHRSFAEFTADPLASWVETTFGLAVEEGTGRLVRRDPDHRHRCRRRAGVVDRGGCRLVRDRASQRAAGGIQRSASRQPAARLRVPPAPVPVQGRHHLRLAWSPRTCDTSPAPTRPASPTTPTRPCCRWAFCRECGQEYLVVAKATRDRQEVFVSRRDNDASGGDRVTGYLYVSSDLPWPDDPLATGRLPESWLITDPATDRVEILDSKRKYLPEKVFLQPDGTLDDGGSGLPAWFVSTPFAFCMRCGVSYEQVRGNDFGKLATLDAEGRSSAMTLLSASIVGNLRKVPEDELPRSARKLLTFVDNRQDASLQAGHFNDFVQVAQLRAALHTATQRRRTRRVDAREPRQRGHRCDEPERAGLRHEPGRQVRCPQGCRTRAPLGRGVPAVRRPSAWLAGDHAQPRADRSAEGRLPRPSRARPPTKSPGPAPTCWTRISAEQREELARILLDELRRVRAVEVDCLQRRGSTGSSAWPAPTSSTRGRLGEDERVVEAGVAIPRPARAGGRRALLAVSGRGAFGKYLRRDAAGLPGPVTTDDATRVIEDLFEVLSRAGVLARTDAADGA